MATSKKVTTSIRVNDTIREKLKEQAAKLGMDVSNYISYLVLYKEEKEKEEQRSKNMMIDFLRALIDNAKEEE